MGTNDGGGVEGGGMEGAGGYRGQCYQVNKGGEVFSGVYMERVIQHGGAHWLGDAFFTFLASYSSWVPASH